MKKKKLLSFAVASALMLPAVIGISGCSCSSSTITTSKARDIYAMSAVSSISYLMENSNEPMALRLDASNRLLASSEATTRPSELSDGDITGIKNCLSMFDSMLIGGGFEQVIVANTATDALLSGYTFEMNISIPTVDAEVDTYKMYFNEIKKETQTKIDDGKQEIEEDTTFEGVVVYGDEKFVVKGEREFEKEGNETSSSIEFITYRNRSETAIVADDQNYVVVEQSVENDEVEYEYAFYSNGVKVQDIELEYEEERNSVEIEFQLVNLTSGAREVTIFRLKKGNESNTIMINYTKNDVNGSITVTIGQNNTYKFVYSNGYEETV